MHVCRENDHVTVRTNHNEPEVLATAGPLSHCLWPARFEPNGGIPPGPAAAGSFGANAIILFFNIVGEEFWWRGFLLPRMERAFGRHAWLLHGLLWNLFHLFKWWDLLNLLPICLLISYFSQKTGRNWPALIAHLLFNGLGFVLVLAHVAGWLS